MLSLVPLYVCGCLVFPCMYIIHWMVQWDLRVVERNELSWSKLYYVRNLWGLFYNIRKGGDSLLSKCETVPWFSCLIGKRNKWRVTFLGCYFCEMKRCMSFQVISFLSASIWTCTFVLLRRNVLYLPCLVWSLIESRRIERLLVKVVYR